MTSPIPVRAYATTGVVDPETYERLRAMTAPHHWEPVLTERGGTARAWLRNVLPGIDGRPARIFGRPAPTAQEAVELLAAKVERMARGGSR